MVGTRDIIASRETVLGRLRRRTMLPLVAGLVVALIPLSAHPANAAEITLLGNVGVANQRNNGTTLPITLTSGVAAGNTVVVSFAMVNAAGAVSATDTAGNTYRVDADATNASGVRTVILSSFTSSALSTGNAITVTFPNQGSNRGEAASVAAFSGLVAASVTQNYDQRSASAGNTATASTGSTPATAQKAELLVASFGVNGVIGDTFGTDAAFTALTRQASSGGSDTANATVNPAYRIVNASGTYAASGTLSPAREWAGAIVTYKRTNVAPVAGAPTATTTEDAAASVTLTASDADGANATTPDALSFTVTSGPTDGSLNVTSGSMTRSGTNYSASVNYTPDLNFNGTDSFTYQVDDGNGGTSSGTATLTITPVNDAPSVSLSGDDSADEGQTKTYTYVVTDPDGPAPTITESCGLNATKIDTAAPDSFDCVLLDGPGSSTVAVTVDDGTASDTDSKLVTVANVAPSLTLSGDATADEGDTKTYAYSITDPGADTFPVPDRVPDCDDGTLGDHTTTASGGSFDCTFSDNGSADVAIAIEDDDGGSDSDTLAVTIADVVPSVSISGDTTVNEGATKTYTYTVTDPADETGAPSESCGSATYTDTAAPNSFDCTFADGPASSTVNVTVTDDDSNTSDDPTAVTVSNVAPTVTLSGPATVDEGDTETYTYTVTDPGTDTATVVETCGAGGTYTDTAAADSFDCTFPAPGSSVVNATATDTDGDASGDPTTVTISDVVPTVELSGDTEVDEGATKTYTYTVTDPADETGAASESCGSATYTDTAAPNSFDCTFADGPASSTVNVTVTDDDSNTSDDPTAVTVSNVAPTVTLSGPATVDEGDTEIYTYTVTDPGTDTATVVETCGAGGTYTDTAAPDSFDCTFPDPGTSVVYVLATDSDGDTSGDPTTVTVSDVVPTVELSGDTEVDEGATVTYTYTVTDPADETGAASESCGSATYTDTAAPDSFDCTFADGPATPVVNVTVSDDDANTADDPTTVTISNVAPTATFTAPGTGDEGSDFSISLNSVSDPAGANDTLEFAFDCGSGYGPFGAATSRTCTAVGGPASQTVKGKVRDEDGGVTEYEASVTIDVVSPPPPPPPPPPPGDTTPPEMEWLEVTERFSPNGDGWVDTFDVDGSLSEEATWTLSISGGSEEGQLLGTGTGEPSFEVSDTRKTVSAQWDGTSTDGSVLDDGTYRWTVTARNAAGNDMPPATGTVVVDRTAPVLLGMRARPNPFHPSWPEFNAAWSGGRKRCVRIRFSVNEASTVTVKIRRRRTTVRSFAPVALAQPGSLKFKWNGRDNLNMLVREGRYRVVIKVVDLVANRTVNRALRIRVVR